MKKIFGDSVPSIEQVRFRGEIVQTRGLSLGQLIELFSQFPDEILKVLGGGKMTDVADVAGNAIIAMGTGVWGDEEQRSNIANISSGEKASFLASIIRQTAPGGVGPFGEMLAAAFAIGAEEQDSEAIRLRLRKSLEPQTSSAPLDSAA